MLKKLSFEIGDEDMTISLKRVYEKADITDGERILVDRLWPRGIRRSTSNIDYWVKNVAPSTELRKWYAHEPKRWGEFKAKYIKELKENRALDKFVDYLIQRDTVTFLYAAKDTIHNNAVVLLQMVNRRMESYRKQLSRIQH